MDDRWFRLGDHLRHPAWLFEELLMRPQFSLLGIFAIIAISAVVMRLRPTPGVTVFFKENNEVFVNNELTNVDNVIELVKSERQWRRIWMASDRVEILLDASVLRRSDTVRHPFHPMPPVQIDRRPRLTSTRLLAELLDMKNSQ